MALTIIIIVGFFFLVLSCLGAIIRVRINQILSKFNSDEIILKDLAANFFGLQSLGVKQVRGNGVLILTKEYLYFEYWIPKRQVTIDLDRIESITKANSHLAKTKGRELLKIFYNQKNGTKDSAAWLVKNLDAWMKYLMITRGG
jgi:hypothetical protein